MSQNNFLQRFNQTKKGASQKTISKDEKKQLSKILKDAFKMAADDQTAVFKHNGENYILERLDRRNDFMRNGGNIPSTPLEKKYVEYYRTIHHYMGRIDPVKYPKLFQDIDYFSFPFAEMMKNIGSKSKVVKLQMKKLCEEWETFFENSEELQAMIRNEQQDTGKLT